MINTRFAFEPDVVLDYDDDIREAALEIDPDATELMFSSGETYSLDLFRGRTAGQDAEVETADEYDALPLAYATLR